MKQPVECRRHDSADLRHRIDALARELPRLSPCRLAHAVDELRRIARMQGFGCVADLAHRLESRIATSSHAAIVLPYLDAMRDATSLDEVPEQSSDAYLAFMGSRLHG